MEKREKCWKLFLINILILTLSFSFISASTSLTSINVNPSITNSNPVLTVTLSESNSSYLISGAEYFIDSAGVSGTGNSLTASDGAYDELTEDTSASIDLTGLSQGSHTVYAHGLNNNSEWGAFSTVSFTKDTIIPTLTSMQITGAYGATNKISPQNADGKYDSVRIIMNSSESVDWGKTSVLNSTGQEIKYFNGPSGYINSNIETWDGKNSSGNYVLDGVYTIYTNITDQAGNSNLIYVGSVIIDNTAPIGTITKGTPIISNNDLTQEITINYNEVMDTSYRPLINFTNNIGEIRSTGGSWSTNQIWTENFLVEDADEETTNVIISSSLAKDLVENSEATSISASFSIDTKAPVISSLQINASDIEINNDNDVTISADISEGMSTPINVWLEGNWTGTSANNTLSSSSGHYSYTISKTQLSNQEYVGWRIFTRDSRGNIRSTSINGFLVKNRAPLFIPSINNMSWIEDGGSKTINLSDYFYDLDKDILNYTATVVSNRGPTSDPNPLGGITVTINNATKIATISSTSDWNGDGTIIFYAWDFVGGYNRSNTVYVTVIADDNEAPTLTSSLSPVNFSEDTTFSLQLFCDPNDPAQVCLNYRYDASYIDYNSNLTVSVNPSTGQVTLSPKLNWNGLTYVKFLADDNGVPLETGSLVVRVNVTPVNDNPILDAPDISMIENSAAPSPINLLSYTTDVDNQLTSMVYNLVSQSNTSLINCSLNVNTINCGAPAYNKYGISDLIVSVIDGSGGSDSQKITIEVKKNHAPTIRSYFPVENPLIRTGRPQTFVLVAQDVDNLTALNYVWKVDGTIVQNGIDNNYIFTPSAESNYIVSAEVSDEVPNTVTKSWTVKATTYPITTEFNGDETTNLSNPSLDLTNVSLVLENSYGKIEFLSPVDLTKAWDLDNNVEISSNGLVAVNTQLYPALNKPARITLYGLSYSSLPKVYYSSSFTTSPLTVQQECSSPRCNLLNYTAFPTSAGEVTFTVSQFSSYAVKGSGINYDINKLDLDKCENGVQGNLTVEIKNPDEDESFGPGAEIKIKLKVSNDNSFDDKFIAKGILYNLDEEDEEETEESDSVEIETEDSETIEFSLIVPEDMDEEDDYVLFVKVYQKGEEENQCNYQIIDLSLEREEHKVIINDIVSDLEINTGEKLNLDIDLENIGSSDEDEAYIKITNSELKLNEKTDTFEIEKYGDDNELTISHSILIPQNAAGKEYTLRVEVFYEDGSTFQNYIINVNNKSIISYVPTENLIYLSSSQSSGSGSSSPKTITASKTTITGKITEKAEVEEEAALNVNLDTEDKIASEFSTNKSSVKVNYNYLPIVLGIGILIFVFAIVYLLIKKR